MLSKGESEPETSGCQFRKLSDRKMCPSAPTWEWTWILWDKSQVVFTQWIAVLLPEMHKPSWRSMIISLRGVNENNFTVSKTASQEPPEREIIQTHVSSRILNHALQDRQKAIVNHGGLCHGLLVQEFQNILFSWCITHATPEERAFKQNIKYWNYETKDFSWYTGFQ